MENNLIQPRPVGNFIALATWPTDGRPSRAALRHAVFAYGDRLRAAGVLKSTGRPGSRRPRQFIDAARILDALDSIFSGAG